MRTFIRTATVLGQKVDVSGFCDPDTPAGSYEGIDLFIGEDCINLGECFYEPPTDEQIEPFVRVLL